MALVQCKECGKDISDSVAACPHCGYDRKEKSKKIGCVSWFVIIIFGFAIIGAITGKPGTHTSSTETRFDPVKSAVHNVKIDKFSWRLGGFNTVMIASFVITNNNNHQVSDIEIECNLNAKSGTRIDRNTKVIYQSIQPKKTLKINDFSMGFTHSQAATAGCQVIGLRPN